MTAQKKKVQDKELLQVALEDIVEHGWVGLNLCRVAKTAGVGLEEVHQAFPTKFDVLQEWARRVDQATLAQIEPFAPEIVTRDRLFAIIMERFDVLENHKQVVRILMQEGWQDPLLVLCSLPRGLSSIVWMLEAGGIATQGLLGAIRVKAFAIFYLSMVYVWLQDHTEDLSETMAALDRGLKRLEKIPGFLEEEINDSFTL